MDETLVHQPVEERRLNPFAFPPETNVRFNLLIVAVIMLAVDSFILLITFATGRSGPFDSTSLFPSLAPANDAQTTLSAMLAALWQSLSSGLLAVCIIAGVIGVVLVVANFLYRSHPARIRRAQRLAALPADKDRRFSAEFADLASLAGVSPVPAIEIGQKSSPADGQVFGFKGRYSVRLGAGMRLVMRKSPLIFRGTVLHELAHIANGDIGRAYFSQSLWTSVILLMLAPVALIYVGEFAARVASEVSAAVAGEGGRLFQFFVVAVPSFVWVMVQLAGLLALLASIRGSLLRAREIYADWRAALWGARPGLEAIFSANQRRPRPLEALRLWQLHPPPHTRLRLLKNPRALFGVPDDVPALAGALVGAAVSGCLYLTILAMAASGAGLTVAEVALVQGSSDPGLTRFVVDIVFAAVIFLVLTGPFLGLAYLTAGSLGLQALRDGVAAAALRERGGLGASLRLLVPALLYASGLQLGFVLTPVSFFAPLSSLFSFEGEAVTLLLLPLGTLVWLIGMALVIWLWLVWGRTVSRRWIARHAGARPPDRRRRVITLYMTVLFWVILLPLLVTQTSIWDLTLKFSTIIPAGVLSSITMAGLAAFVIMALLGWLIVEILSLGPITCPACGQKSKQRVAVGRRCEHCGAELAPWLIIQPVET